MDSIEIGCGYLMRFLLMEERLSGAEDGSFVKRVNSPGKVVRGGLCKAVAIAFLKINLNLKMVYV